MKTILTATILTIFTAMYLDHNRKRLDDGLEPTKMRFKTFKGNLDTIYLDKDLNAPWRTFTQSQIINNEYPQRKKY